jgi:intracellular septation protein
MLALLLHLVHKHSMSKLKQPTPWLRTVVEYGPIVVFLMAYYTADLYVATASIMAATVFALLLSYILERHVPIMPLITAGIIGIFGGLTLWLQDEIFIKMKPTIIQAIFGTILISGLMVKRLFLKSLMGAAWNITDKGWRVLTVRFTIFFFLLAALNEVVWRTQSTDVWVNFKVFGLMGLTIIFVLTQLPLLKRYAIEDNINDHK